MIAHNSSNHMLMCTVLGLPVHRRWDFRIDFSGIVEIAYQPDYGTWKVIRFNQACN